MAALPSGSITCQQLTQTVPARSPWAKRCAVARSAV